MSYLRKWHPDYAAESIKRFELRDNADRLWIEYAIECGEVARLALDLDEKTADIARTVVDTIDESDRLGKRSRRKITPKQRYAVGRALIEKYGTARAVAARVWGLSDAAIDSASI